ncbi:MAG: TonB-dependent receptor, partial [Pseudomonadota bacterium]
MILIVAAQLALAMAALSSSEATLDLQPIQVQARDLAADSSESVAQLTADQLASIRPSHPNEVFSRIPGAWLTRGSGQEHLTAIRSPLLTGAGGCGGLLYMEEGVPIRPPGFCNINNLFEVNLLQARAVVVLRGPGGIGHASGGLHGVVDVRTRAPDVDRWPGTLRVEAGSESFYRLETTATFDLDQAGALAIDFNATDAGSFREDEGYRHGLFTAHHELDVGTRRHRTVLSAAQLDQDTAGFIFGEDAYRDSDLRVENLNPEAFRRGSAVRLLHRIEWADQRLTLFARRSRMTFLQHFLPGKPLERNGQVSGGLQFDAQRRFDAWSLEWGLDAELFDGFLFQRQDQPTEGSPFLVATRPVGLHYDYDVFGQRAGGYLAAYRDLNAGWSISAGLHADWIRYDYDNKLMPGNLNDQGEPCGFGGCLYNRPADRDDTFANIAPEFTLTRSFDLGSAWLRLARGFRAPQATDLYRLQRGQDVADLDSETLDALEVGVRGLSLLGDHALSWEWMGFVQRKRNVIFRDGDGFNVSDGTIESIGLEYALSYSLDPDWTIGARGTWARHQYDFDRSLGGEVIVSGNDVDSAPRNLVSADLTWQPLGSAWLAQLAVEHTGRYFLNASNTERYEGHTLVHAFAGYRWPSGW